MNEYTIYALKIENEEEFVFNSIKNGEGRFGWSDIENGDLNVLKCSIDRDGWDSLSKDEKECYQGFLLDIKPGDYAVFINCPEWGKCTVAKITGSYYWKYDYYDFNHRFTVDPNSVYTFDRNDQIVHPALSARLKLRGRWWRIYVKKEFEELIEGLKKGKAGKPRTFESGMQLLVNEIKPFLNKITENIHKIHPGSELEYFSAKILENIPGIKQVEIKGGAGDYGADILITCEVGIPIPGLIQQKICVVQVKSYEGAHWDTRAIEDIKRAFDHYPEAEMGLIISTATESTEALEKALDNLKNERQKPVGLLLGTDVAMFFLQYGSNLIQS